MRSRRWPAAFAYFLIVSGLFAVPSFTGAGESSNQPPHGRSERIPGRYIVDLKPGENVDAVSQDVAQDAGGNVTAKYKEVIGGFAFKGPDDALDDLRNDPRVARVDPDYVVTAVDTPDASADHLATIGVTGTNKAWQRSQTDGRWGGDGIRIGILDTGIQTNIGNTQPQQFSLNAHTVFAGHSNVVAVESVADGNCNGGSGGRDLNGHGTATASNAAGRIGAAHLAKLHGIKVFPGSGTTTAWEHVICGLNRVVNWNNSQSGTANDIRVVNLSLTGGGTSALNTAVQSVINSGVTVVAAAGNSGASTPGQPASYNGVISTSALNHAGTQFASFSNKNGTGTSVHVPAMTAPGDTIYSANYSSSSTTAFANRSGTSRSSPMVAGAAAVALAFNPNLTPAQVATVLEQSGTCPNGQMRGANTCSTNWSGDTSPAEPRVNVLCAGVLAAGITDPACASVAPPAAANIAINDVSITEGNSGTKNLGFTVTRSGNTTSTATFNYATGSFGANPATAGSDYVAIPTTQRTMSSGVTQSTINVVINGGTGVEQNETFAVNLSSPNSGTTITDGQGVGTILNDDSPPAAANIAINDVSITEGNSGTKNLGFTVTRSGNTTSTATFNYATGSFGANPATAGSDYVAIPTTQRTMSSGVTQSTINVVINGGTGVEQNETFAVNLSSPNSGTTITDGQGVGTILNDDSSTLPTVAINNVSATEGAAGTTKTFTFTVTRSSNAGAVSMQYATSDGTAAADSDYVAESGTVSFTSGGLTSATIGITVNGDSAVEGNETFNVTLSNLTGATFSDDTGVGTITNDDSDSPPGSPELSINNIAVSEGDAGTTAFTFTVTRSFATPSESSVNYATANSSAVAPSDYVAESGVATIAANQTSTTITISVNGDTSVETSELFIVYLSGPSGASIDDDRGNGTILDDD